jgi:hypothetical protein
MKERKCIGWSVLTHLVVVYELVVFGLRDDDVGFRDDGDDSVTICNSIFLLVL